MGAKPDYVRKKFAPLLDKTLRNALAHRLGTEFPRLGGPRILELCAEMILEVVNEHQRPRETIGHGQVLWLAVSIDDPPARGKHMADTDLVPVVLDLSSEDDVRAVIDRTSMEERILTKAIRLSVQAHEQGGLLGNCDLAEILGESPQRISSLLVAYEREHGTVVPRRATLHDVGTGVTHKRIICWKRYAEGKTSDQIARETYHSIEAVDRYLGQFDRVRACHYEKMSPEQTAFTLNCSLGLVRQYLEIDQALEDSRHE